MSTVCIPLVAITPQVPKNNELFGGTEHYSSRYVTDRSLYYKRKNPLVTTQLCCRARIIPTWEPVDTLSTIFKAFLYWRTKWRQQNLQAKSWEPWARNLRRLKLTLVDSSVIAVGSRLSSLPGIHRSSRKLLTWIPKDVKTIRPTGPDVDFDDVARRRNTHQQITLMRRSRWKYWSR